MKKNSEKKILALAFVLAAVSVAVKFLFFKTPGYDFEKNEKRIILECDGLFFSAATEAADVSELLREKNISLGEKYEIFPEINSPLGNGMTVKITSAIPITVIVDGKTIKNKTAERTVGNVLRENGIKLNPLDKISPDPSLPLTGGSQIKITRINVEEKTVSEDIPFKTVQKTDSQMGWREKKVEQEGKKGVREIKYKITYKDGREISRVVLEKRIAREPVSETVVQGTYVKLGKSHSGLGTWYAFKGGLFAANPWLPIGSYVKVTNQANGKSVIVQINDRGPFGPGRIIDLDKVAFAKIASLGAGVINVKMEEILN